MNWEAIGTISEVIGASAVVITLGYLAIQMRQNTRAIKATSFMESQHFFAELHDYLAQSPDLVDLAIRAFDPSEKTENFSPHELMRLGMLGRAVMQRTEAQYYLHKNGFLDDEFWEMRRSWMRGWFDMPVWREWWQSERDQGTVTLSFIASIESAEPIRLNVGGFNFFAGADESTLSGR